MKMIEKVFNDAFLLKLKITFIFLSLLTASVAMASTYAKSTDKSENKYVTIDSKQGRYYGWPANNGLWTWDDGREILVGYTDGPHDSDGGFHQIGNPQLSRLARSTDGGHTWTSFDPENYVGDGGNLVYSPGNINFGHPDFVMRVAATGYHGTSDAAGRFFYSYDRGQTWNGPYRFNGLTDGGNLDNKMITARTDYRVTGPNSAQIFMTARPSKPSSGPDYPHRTRRDKPFVVETTDGGKTFNSISWVVDFPDDLYDECHRAAMPSTVVTDDGNLVMVTRGRNPFNNSQQCWIDAHRSEDNGRTWTHLNGGNAIALTGVNNGNPAGLTILDDGRLVVTCGNRDKNQVLIRVSEDNGDTWGDEIVVRDNLDNYDFGYPLITQNSDGHLVVIYYMTNDDRTSTFIEAAIFQP